MAKFDDFYKELAALVKSYTDNETMLKVESDLESQIIRIFGERVSSLGRAKNGLADASELAFTTAEHHPYWSLLYNACQIAKITLDKWESDLTREEIDEISWSLDELKNTCQKILANPHNDHTH
ncbi:hypothetical protein [Candidatus Nitrosotenuis aquarius]|jgi:hypothetical protein|uniref:hypothetical protein n=1 Tax=Candidatus Nitrosotenuis aquarius TaxID=1846278 RepID=UPI000C1EF376|nr:hypothetical protein [Candidatus Nitrosotenuis aquarius]